MVVLDDAQRDAVYQFVLVDLGDVANLARIVRLGEVERAKQIRRQLDQDLRLLDQIGWQEQGDLIAYPLALSTEEVKAIFCRLHAQADHVINAAMAECAVHLLTDAFSVVDICKWVLGELPGGTPQVHA